MVSGITGVLSSRRIGRKQSVAPQHQQQTFITWKMLACICFEQNMKKEGKPEIRKYLGIWDESALLPIS